MYYKELLTPPFSTVQGHWFKKEFYISVMQLDPEAAEILNTLQQTLNTVLDDLSSIFAKRLVPKHIKGQFLESN